MSGALMLAVTNAEAAPLSEFFGRQMSRATRELDPLAIEMGVLPLSSFVSLDAGDQEMMAELAAEGGVDTSDWKAEPVKWFDPTEGLKTVQALIKGLGDDQKTVKNKKAILSELKELQAALMTIKERKARWRFWIDY